MLLNISRFILTIFILTIWNINDKIVEFVKDLNEALNIEGDKILVKELIDPEDWQEIADIRNAYEDLRYTSL